MSLHKLNNSKNILIVSGLAGSGKTIASHALEDLGYYCIDNLPPILLKFFTFQEVVDAIPSDHIVLELDSRDPQTPQTLHSVFEKLEKHYRVELLYLDASLDALLHRFRETRRAHPLIALGCAKTLNEAIEKDIETLSPIKDLATHVLDTTHLKPKELRRFILKNFSFTNQTGLHLNFVSFGFKYGVPNDLDTLFDVRCFKNPFYEAHLKELSGLNEAIKAYVFSDENVHEFFEKVKNFIEFMYPKYVDEGKHFLNVGIGCTGGKHRSVVLTEALYKYFKEKFPLVTIEHRNIDD